MASIEYIVNAVDSASGTFQKVGLSADDLSRKLDDLGKKDITPKVGLTDTEFTAKMLDASKKLDKLNKTVADPKIDVQGLAKASLQIDTLERQLNRLDRKEVTPSVALGGAGGAAAAAAGGAGGGGGFLNFLGSPGGAGAIGGALPIVSALFDALVGQGIGTGVGGAALIGARKYDEPQLDPGFNLINQALRPVFKSVGPSIGLMLAQLGQFTKAERNPLAKLFGSSLPFLQQFTTLLEKVAKTLLPSLTQVMQEFVKTGALKEMTQGFVILAQGVAEFIKELGPGFKAGAEVFRAISIVIRDALIGLGQVFGGLGGAAGHAFTFIHDKWDQFRHWMSSEFDTWRHGWAHDWDVMFSDTIGALLRFNSAASRDFSNWISDVVGFFAKMPGQIAHQLAGLPAMLKSLGSSALHDFLSGLESGGAAILGWIKNFFAGIPHAILSIFHMSPPHAGSVFYDLGANLMHHLEAGIQSRAGRVAGAVHGSMGVPAGLGGSAQRIAAALLPRYGWGGQWGALNAVEMAEAGWNLTARNPSSGAYGIAQFINGPSEYYQYGGNPNTAAGQVIAFFNYIRQRYGNPSAAWAHEQQFHWYGSGLQGGIFTRPTVIGVGERGPEQVTVTPMSGPDRQAQMVAALQQVIMLLRAQPAQNGKAFGDALSGVTRGAAYGGRYSAR